MKNLPISNISLELAIDSEFTFLEDGTAYPISIQGVFKYKDKLKKLIVLNSKYKMKLNLTHLFEFSLEDDIEVYFDDFEDPFNSLILYYFYESLKKDPDYMNLDGIKTINIVLYLYYSAKDLTYCFGYSNLKPYYLGKLNYISQKRNIVGTFYIDINNIKHVITIRDLYGYNQYGLKVLAESVGLEKLDVLDSYKTQMDLALIEKTEDFIRYSMNDAILLFEIYSKKIATFNEILAIFGINEQNAQFTKVNTPSTIGSVVYNIFIRYLRYNVLKNDSVYLACLKQGILNKANKAYVDNLNHFEFLNKFDSLNELIDYSKTNIKQFKSMLTSLSSLNAFSYYIWQYSSIDYLISESSKNTYIPLLGLTTGGRTVNERPKEYQIKYGADIDIQGAYGTKLSQLIFPIGRPRIFSHTFNDQNLLTLGEFMSKMKKQVTSGLYKICVEGNLTFEQDLIFSKLSSNDLSKHKIVYDKEDPETAAIDAPFVLLRKEIKNGFITESIWDVLKKVCTNCEFKQIKNLKVLSAVYWLDSDRVDNIEMLADEFLSDKGKYQFDNMQNTIVDTRTYKWYGFSLYNFINPLMEKRLLLKKNKDSFSFALQDAIKLVVNTTWGLLTSPYFDINNVVCSEIVTSSIRTNVWMLNKALNTYLSITDGGPYSLMAVTYLKKGSLPGLNVLSNYYKYSKHRSISIKPLNNINWETLFDSNVSYTTEPFTKLDHYAQEHVEAFWSRYNLKFNVKLEHKLKTTFIKASYFSKAHYLFKIYDFETNSYSVLYHKIRGYRNETNIKYQNPIYYFLIHLLDCKEDSMFMIQNKGVYYTKKLLKINSWKKSIVINDKKQTISKYGANVQPGDSIYIECYFRLNNSHFYINTLNEYKTRLNRSHKYTVKKEVDQEKIYKTPLFEKYLPICGIKKTFEAMELDNLRMIIKIDL